MTTEHNNLVTRVSELEAECERLRLKAWDHYAAAALNGLLTSGRFKPPSLAATESRYYATAMMIERDKR